MSELAIQSFAGRAKCVKQKDSTEVDDDSRKAGQAMNELCS